MHWPVACRPWAASVLPDRLQHEVDCAAKPCRMAGAWHNITRYRAPCSQSVWRADSVSHTRPKLGKRWSDGVPVPRQGWLAQTGWCPEMVSPTASDTRAHLSDLSVCKRWLGGAHPCKCAIRRGDTPSMAAQHMRLLADKAGDRKFTGVTNPPLLSYQSEHCTFRPSANVCHRIAQPDQVSAVVAEAFVMCKS